MGDGGAHHMTCIVLVKNPDSGGVMAITEDEGEIATWEDTEKAEERASAGHPLVSAWGGFVVDLDNLEVTEV